MTGQLLRWISGGIVVAALAWLAISVNLADYFARERNEPENALRWRSEQPHALAAIAYDKVLHRQPDAGEWVERALRAFPTSGSLHILRAFLALRAGDEQATREHMARAERMAPANPTVRRNLATLAASLDDPEAMVRHWARVADHFRHRRDAIERLAALAESPQTAAQVRLLAAQTPEWWPDLLVRVARQGRHPESVEPLLRVTRYYEQPIPAAVTRARIERLQRAGEWRRAYLLWIDSLDAQQLSAMGFLYNGRFSLPLSNADFDWRHERIGGVRIGRAEPDGAGNGWAMYAHFPTGRYPFRHVHQKLVLPSGDYVLHGALRTERMETARGFSWVIRCPGRNGLELGRTDPVAHSPEWQGFELAFSVPRSGCPAQELRLILDGRIGPEFDVSGTFWSRDLAIGRRIAERL